MQASQADLKEAIMALDEMITECKKDLEVFQMSREYMVNELVRLRASETSPIVIGS
jgi:hypothetical protein